MLLIRCNPDALVDPDDGAGALRGEKLRVALLVDGAGREVIGQFDVLGHHQRAGAALNQPTSLYSNTVLKGNRCSNILLQAMHKF